MPVAMLGMQSSPYPHRVYGVEEKGSGQKIPQISKQSNTQTDGTLHANCANGVGV